MDKERIIQEFVPGKQVTLAHLIATRVKNWRKRSAFPKRAPSAS